MSTGCKMCALGYQSDNQIDAKGSNNPDYYIVGYVCNEYEVNSNNVFDNNSSKSYSYLNGTLASLGINETNARFNKLIRCISENRKVTMDHRTACVKYLLNDIYTTKPKVVILLGSEVAVQLLGEKYKYVKRNHGKLIELKIQDFTTRVVITYSPNYIVSSQVDDDSDEDEESQNTSNTEASEIFFSDLAYARKYVNGELVDISTKDLRYAMTYNEFKDYFDRYLINAENPAYDIESNAKEPRCSDFRIIGFSLAPDETTGIYIVRDSLEYSMPKVDWDQIVEMTKKYLMSRVCTVHNCMYEIPATENEWKIFIKNFEDTLGMARLLLGGHTGAGLKEQCAINLGYPAWDEDLGIYAENFTELWNNLYPTSSGAKSGKNKWDFEILKTTSLLNLLNEYKKYISEDDYKRVLSSSLDEMKDKKSDILYSKIILDKCDLKKSEILNIKAINNLIDLISEYYEPHEVDNIVNLAGKAIQSLIESRYDGIMPYNCIPLKIIRKYGAMDAVGTKDLQKCLLRRFDEESTDEVNYHNGYRIIKKHLFLGACMEMNGLYWNDDIANDVYNWASGVCYESLLAMLDSGYLDDVIAKKSEYLLNDYVVNNQMDIVQDILGDFTYTKSGIKLSDGRKIALKNIIYSLGDNFIKNHREDCIRLGKEAIHDKSKHPDFYSLKYYFNPQSNLNKTILDKILVDINIQVGYIITRLTTLMESEEFNIESYPYPDRSLFEIIRNIKIYNKEVSEYNESDEAKESGMKKEKIPQTIVFQKFYNALENMVLNDNSIRKIVQEAMMYHLTGTSEPLIIELYDYYKATGIDIENEATYTDQFKFLYNFRMFKKCVKLIASYIDGNKVGRGSVWKINRKDIDNNSIEPIRTSLYDWHGKKDDEEYLMQSKWSVCTARTLRWQSGIHTIPAKSCVKNIYTSRYKGGVIAAPDYSQLELRMTSGLSGDENMIKIFKDGGDMHRMTASKVYRKPPEEITDVERRFCKMAGFRILYGSSAEGLANQFLDGDINFARSIIDGFFEAYPKVKVMMDKAHYDVEHYGKVACSKIGYYLHIDTNGPEGLKGAQRESFNAIIQSQGSMMAGYVMSCVNDYILDHNLRTKPISFIHDSLEFDIPPEEVFEIGKQIIPMMNKTPMEEFDIMTKADLTLGTSMGTDSDVEEIECDDKYNEGIIVFKGFKENLDAMYENWKDVMKVCEIEDSDEKVIYNPRSDLFMSKLAIAPYFGKERIEIKRKFKLIIK